jgi:hypothetical protein
LRIGSNEHYVPDGPKVCLPTDLKESSEKLLQALLIREISGLSQKSLKNQLTYFPVLIFCA